MKVLMKSIIRHKLTRFYFFAAAVTFISSGCDDSTTFNEPFNFKEIFIEQVKPSEGDLRRMELYPDSDSLVLPDSFIYIVKIRADLPPPSNSGFRIYFGDEQVKEFGSYNEGIFFKVYHKKDLNDLAGKELLYSFDPAGEILNPTGIFMPVYGSG